VIVTLAPEAPLVGLTLMFATGGGGVTLELVPPQAVKVTATTESRTLANTTVVFMFNCFLGGPRILLLGQKAPSELPGALLFFPIKFQGRGYEVQELIPSCGQTRNPLPVVAGTVPTGRTDVSTEGTNVAVPVTGFTSVKVPPLFGWSAFPMTAMLFTGSAVALTGIPGNAMGLPTGFSVLKLKGMATLPAKSMTIPIPNESKVTIALPPGRLAVAPVNGWEMIFVTLVVSTLQRAGALPAVTIIKYVFPPRTVIASDCGSAPTFAVVTGGGG